MDRPAANKYGTRSVVLATHAMVATSQPLASVAALDVIQEGGNAVDASITAAAVLNVVEPMMTGVGGDMFALLFMQEEGRPVGLNGSGWSGSDSSPDYLRSHRIDTLEGIHTVTVPGAVAGWFKLHERYGTLPMSRLLAPAIDYADQGFPVSQIIAGDWAASEQLLRSNDAATRTYLRNGRAPGHGEIFHTPDLGESLRQISEHGRDAFYKGDIARRIVSTSEELGGFLNLADFEEFEAAWVEPISTGYRGYEVYEMPPNTQGIVALQMLNIMEGFDLEAMGHNSAAYLHTLVEAKKLAFADRARYIADPDHTSVPTDRLISKDYAADRRGLIDADRAREDFAPGFNAPGDTVYLSVVDRDRNVVSFINSLFSLFGSGVVADGTGICLHSRGRGFSTEAGHPNVIAARKRPFHTLVPALVLKEGQPYFSFGVMGGDMQAQGHAQVLANLIDFGMDPQQAGEAPRFRHTGPELALESSMGANVRHELARRGHEFVDEIGVFGGFQGILIDPTSRVLSGGSDPRKDGLAIGW